MRLRLLLKSTILTALLILSVNVGWGQALLTESFNYTTPAYVGGNGAIGTSSNGWTTHSVTSGQATTIGVYNGSLSYPGLAAPVGNKVMLPASNITVSRDINSGFTTTNTSLYYSALINVLDVTQLGVSFDYFMSFGETSGTATMGFSGRLGAKSVNALANFRLGILNTSTGTLVYGESSDLSFGTTYLVVVKVDRSTTPITASLWVNPASLGGADPAGAIINTSGTGAIASFASICLRNSSGTPKVEIDEIRVGTTFASVTPENLPAVATFNPANASVTADPTTNIVVTFDKAVLNTDASVIADPTSLITFKATDAAGADIAFTASINAAKTEITINPTPVLGYATTYYVAIAPVEDVVGKESVLQSATFTTRIQDVVAPTWTAAYPKVGAIANSDFNLLVNLNEIGKAYYVVLPNGGAMPTAAQVKAGQDGASVAALKSGSINVPTAVTEFSANISGLAAGTAYDVYVVAEDVELTPNIQAVAVEVADVTTSDTKPQPANQATAFAAALNSQTAVTLTWVDAIADQLPHSYLILINETGVFANPVDGVALADGASAVNVAFGVKTAQITGLTAGSHYYFNIFAYTNTGTAVDYLLTAAPTADVILPQLALTYPNGGETFYAGDTVSMTWTSTNVTNIAVETSKDNGVTWSPWIASIESDGQDAVVVPSDASYSNQYLLRISDVSNAGIYDVANATFTVKAVTSHLVDLLTMPNNSIVKYVGKATVTYARTSRNQKYIQDETGAVLIDDATTAPGFITGTYAIGDGITNIEAKVFYYSGLVEFTPTAITGEPCTGNPVITPEVRTIESLTHLDQCKLVKIEKFTFATTGVYVTSSAFAASKNYDITGYATSVFAFRTLFAEADYMGLEIPLTPVTAVCLVGQYNTTMQVTARNLADITSTSAEIISSVYTIDFATSVIQGVPEADNLATFKANLTPAAGATFNVFDADGVTPATVLDNTKLIICTAQDGTTKKTYTVEISIYVPSTIATLTKLNYNGTAVNGFLSGSLNYAILLPFGTTVIPAITYTLGDVLASAEVIDVANLTGTEAQRTAKVIVTAEDGVTTKTYSIIFTVYVKSTNASLTKISVNGAAVSGFSSGTLSYAILLPVGTSIVPAVTYILADAKSNAVITNATNLFGTVAERTTSIVVTAEDGTTEKTYSVVFTVDNTGIANNGTLKLNAYPNPAIDEITVTGLANAKQLEILNITGKVIRVIEITSDETLVKIIDLNKGMYFLKTESQTLKFIKK